MATAAATQEAAMEAVEVAVMEGRLEDATWRVPGSKSITNRALILAALRDGVTLLKGVLHSDDTRHMRNALVALGVKVEEAGPHELRVHGGVGRLKQPEGELFIGNSGTSVRFLAAFCCLVPGRVTLTGDKHMAKRPIGDLISALKQMGVEVDCPTGCPPITLDGKGLPGGKVTMPGNKSSQYFSALMLSGSAAAADMTIQVEGTLVSLPYVRMTMTMVEAFGGKIEHDEAGNSFVVRKTAPELQEGEFVYEIEPDASSASYPFALAAATGSSIKVPGLTEKSMQGDFGFTNVLKDMGCTVEVGADYTRVTGPPADKGLAGLKVDMYHISDTVMSLAAIAPLCKGPVEIVNVANIRIKETDRLDATVKELQRLGQDVEFGDDWLKITPGKPILPARIECYADHRMAMSFAVLGKAAPGITITDRACTAKTYPNFWEDLEAVCSPAASQGSPKKARVEA